MSKYARIDNGTAVEIFTPPAGIAITKCFHEDIAALFSVVPDAVTAGSTVDNNGKWTIAIAPEAPRTVAIVTSPKVTPVQFKLLWSFPERLAIKTARASNPALDDFYTILDDPRLTEVDMNLVSTQMAIGYSLNVIAAAMTPAYTGADIVRRVDEIMSGVLT